MELSRRSVFLVPALLLASAGALAAQRPAPQPGTGITGFVSIPWGARAKDLVAAYGVSLIDRAVGDSGQVLIYRDQVAGRSVVAMFYLDRDRGLVKGVYSAPYDIGSDCEVVFEKIKSFVQQLYPALKPVERRKHEDKSLPFCSAATIGKASWSVDWTDPASGNSVEVALEPGETRVAATFAVRGFGRAPRP